MPGLFRETSAMEPMARKRRLPHRRWLLRGHLLGFAFLAHQLQFALRRFDLR